MKKLGAELKRHALTAISYMLPLVVASGLLIAIGNLMGGENVTELSKMTLPSALTTLGVMGMGLLPSFIAGYIAYSIADRPGIAPGFLMGQIASFLGAGFLGGMVGGVFVIPAMSNPLAALIALLAGTAVTGVLLVLIKKKKTEEDEPMVDEKEEDLDLSGFTIS